MSSRSSELRVVARDPIGPGVELVLALPRGALEEPPSSLPVIDVAGLPGAAVVLRRGFTEGDLTLRAACVRGPSDRWAPGIEELVLGRATSLLHRAVGAPLDRWDAGPILAVGERLEQRIEGEGRAPGAFVAARGRHMLGFAGDAKDVVLCSVVCVERSASSTSLTGRCAGLIDEASQEGAFMEAPPPSVLVRLIFLAAERPRAAGLVGLILALGLVAFVLARRPRPRP